MKISFKIGVTLALLIALVPALVSAAPPTPKGKLVYEDDFSSGAKSKLEDNLTATDYQRGFHPPGVYHLKLSKNDQTAWSLFPNQSYAEFSAQVDMFDFSDDINAGTVAQGLAFRAKDNTHFYTVLLDPRNGTYVVRKQDGADKWSDLIASKASPLVKRQKEVNQLRVDGEGGNFTIYLNGEQLDTFKDASYAQGSLGFIVDNTDAKEPHMHFDNIKIYTTDAATTTNTGAAPSDLPPTGQGTADATLLLMLGALLLLSLGVGLRRRA